MSTLSGTPQQWQNHAYEAAHDPCSLHRLIGGERPPAFDGTDTAILPLRLGNSLTSNSATQQAWANRLPMDMPRPPAGYQNAD